MIQVEVTRQNICNELWKVCAECCLPPPTDAMIDDVFACIFKANSTAYYDEDEVNALLDRISLIGDDKFRRSVQKIIATYSLSKMVRYIMEKEWAHGSSLEKDDVLIDLLGVISKCVDKYDPTRGSSFVTYAYKAISTELALLFDGDLRTVSSPNHVHRYLRKVSEALTKLGDNARDDAVARMTGLPEKTVEKVRDCITALKTVPFNYGSSDSDNESMIIQKGVETRMAQMSLLPDEELMINESELAIRTKMMPVIADLHGDLVAFIFRMRYSDIIEGGKRMRFTEIVDPLCEYLCISDALKKLGRLQPSYGETEAQLRRNIALYGQRAIDDFAEASPDDIIVTVICKAQEQARDIINRHDISSKYMKDPQTISHRINNIFVLPENATDFDKKRLAKLKNTMEKIGLYDIANNMANYG